MASRGLSPAKRASLFELRFITSEVLGACLETGPWLSEVMGRLVHNGSQSAQVGIIYQVACRSCFKWDAFPEGWAIIKACLYSIVVGAFLTVGDPHNAWPERGL